MIGNSEGHSGAPNRIPERLTLSALANRLGERPWALAFASFVMTALLILPGDPGFF